MVVFIVIELELVRYPTAAAPATSNVGDNVLWGCYKKALQNNFPEFYASWNETIAKQRLELLREKCVGTSRE